MMLTGVKDEKLKKMPPSGKGRRFFGDTSKFKSSNSSSSSNNASHTRDGTSSLNLMKNRNLLWF